MKKFFALILVIFMGAFLAACISDSEKAEEDAEKQEEKAAEAEENSTTDEEEGASEETEATESEETAEEQATTDSEEIASTEENKTKEASTPANYGYDLGPATDMSTLDQATKDQLQNVLDSFGEITPGEIVFNGVYATYQEDGSLYIEVFVRNGTEHAIYDIESELTVLDANGEEQIASAYFTFPQDQFGVLEPGHARYWSLTFGPEFIQNNSYDMVNYYIQQESTYSY